MLKSQCFTNIIYSLMLKAHLQPPKQLKFHYRTNTNASSRCTPTASECMPSRKDSRVKAKKEQSENGNFGQHSHLVPHKRVFSEIKDKNRMTPELVTVGKKDSATIKEKNMFLESCVKKQSEEIERLRSDVASMRKEVEANLENKRSKETNDGLKDRYQVQSKQMDALRQEVSELKKMLSLGHSAVSEVEIESRVNPVPTQLSRRLEIFSKYEQLAAGLGEEEASRMVDEMEQMRIKYESELRNLTEEVSRLKEKELLVGVLEEQVQNKNETIDFLRRELHDMEANSERLLGAVSSLEDRMDYRPRRLQTRTPRPWGKEDSFHSFNGLY